MHVLFKSENISQILLQDNYGRGEMGGAMIMGPKKKEKINIQSDIHSNVFTSYSVYIRCCLKTIFLGYPIYVWVYICIPSKQ